MIIAVTAWRNHTDSAFIRGQLELWRGPFPLHIRVGDAEGGDAIVLKWCQDNGISHHVFKARRYPSGALMPGAGPQRNLEMLLGRGDPVTDEPTGILIGFPRTDGVRSTSPGSGTFGCVIEATMRGIRVEIPAYRRSGDR